MKFDFDERRPDSRFVETIWRTRSEQAGTFTSSAVSHWEMVVTHYQGGTTLTVRGPETQATPADGPADAEFIGIKFKLGTFMTHLSAREWSGRWRGGSGGGDAAVFLA